MKTKVSNKDKKLFDQKFKEMLTSGKITFVDKFRGGEIVMCMLVKDYDLKSNDLCVDDRNKSYPVDEKCFWCEEQVVMSIKTQEMVKIAREKKIQIGICCPECVKKLLTPRPHTWSKPLTIN